MKYQYWLSNIPGVGCKTIHRLLGQAGSAEEKLESGRKICCAGRKRDLFFILRDGVIS